ncbi:hypothetical protein B0H66DRAFT_604512 [Apodospora peruviana]|uniref:Uncharacterized protein n=1 Tax=Apodospora peruviana TaxID=516989 RepID=A0AAE0M354_9PEZI|nr:hypothetical protein B0H66DRAFT_604512 [Apodospora peruviana]
MPREGTRSATGNSKPRVFPVVDTTPVIKRAKAVKKKAEPQPKKEKAPAVKTSKPVGVKKRAAPKKESGVAKKVKAAAKKVEKKADKKEKVMTLPSYPRRVALQKDIHPVLYREHGGDGPTPHRSILSEVKPKAAPKKKEPVVAK